MDNSNKLIKNIDLINDNQTPIIICFPFAGGGASIYNEWVKYFNGRAIVCPAQLPGREERIMDKCYVDMNELIEELFKIVKLLIKHKIFLFGHSMGAKIAFELEKKLENNNFQCTHLILSASRPPCIVEPNKIHNLSDKEFIRELSKFGGTKKEILENKKLIEFFLPMLRADFCMDETFYSQDIKRLNCPITAFGGDKDKTINFYEIQKWQQYTNKEFELRKFTGGHFFVKEVEESVLKEIENIIFKY